MRLFVLLLLIFLLPVGYMPASAQEDVPVKTWDSPPPKKDIRPINLKSILRGKSAAPKTRGPTSRNPADILRDGGDLPTSEALKQTADFNELRNRLRHQNNFDRLTDAAAKIELANVHKEEEQKFQEIMNKRNEFYLRHGKTDEKTREYLRTKQGRLVRREIRREERQTRREVREQRKVGLQNLEIAPLTERLNYPHPNNDAKTERRSSTIVPTAKPKEGKIKPFFY